jgi:uroporphyrin-III C-methyltransferase
LAGYGYFIYQHDITQQLKTLSLEVTQQKQNTQGFKVALDNTQRQLQHLTQEEDFTLAETNYLVFMAHERLSVAKDIPTALEQLEAAQQKLAQSQDPALLKVKEALAQDIAALRAEPTISRQTLWQQVEILSSQLNQLSFKTLDNAPASETAVLEKTLPDDTPAWKKHAWQSWQELKSLIRVSRETKNPILPVLTAQEEAQTLRAMQMMCEQAKWAVLQGDSKVYEGSLKSLDTWVLKMMADTPARQALLTHIDALLKMSVEFPNIDISATLNALSKSLQRQDPTS